MHELPRTAIPNSFPPLLLSIYHPPTFCSPGQALNVNPTSSTWNIYSISYELMPFIGSTLNNSIFVAVVVDGVKVYVGVTFL